MKCLTSLIFVQAISAFAPPMQDSSRQGATMMKGEPESPPARRTSSLAYDNGFKENFNKVDGWRNRLNLPPKTKAAITTTALASSSSTNDQRDGTMKPIYSFGVLTDIQYAPIPDGFSYSGNARYYRHAKIAAEHAAKHFEEEKVHCVINLGDIVDGKCADLEKWGGSAVNSYNDVEGEETVEEEKKSNGSSIGGGHNAIDDVLEALSSYKAGRILHTYGNHELYSLSRRDLATKLSIPFKLEPTNELVGYYDHLLVPQQQQPSSSSSMKLRFIVLDSYDICLLDRCPETSPKRQLAHELLAANNPNYPSNENSPQGLEGLSKRFVAFNGGVDAPQMKWLEQSLQKARYNNEKVIICSHQPIHPGSTWPTCLMFNYDEILPVVRKYSDVIIASFSGHAHKGGYIRDEISGVHFRTFEAVLESPDPIRTYAIVDVLEDRVVVRGWGDCVSDEYDLDHLRIGTENSVHIEA